MIGYILLDPSNIIVFREYYNKKNAASPKFAFELKI